MSELQLGVREQPSIVEAKDSFEKIGEPGIAHRKASGGTPWESDHSINIRLSIPLFFRRYYVTIVAGQEHRSPERRTAERQKHPLITVGNITALFAAGTVVGTALFTIVQLVGHWYLTQTGWIQP